MIFQFIFTNGAITQTIGLPFTGRCRVKLIKIDYFYDNTAVINTRLMSLQSPQLFNSTPLSGSITFLNSLPNYYGDNFKFIADLPQFVTLNVVGAPPGGAGGYLGLLATFDIEPENLMIN